MQWQRHGHLRCVRTRHHHGRKLLLIMKMLSILLLGGCLQLAASGRAQTLSLSVRSAPLSVVFEKIESQTDLRFVYTESLMVDCKPVTLNIRMQPIDTVLNRVFSGQPLDYEKDHPFIILRRRTLPPQQAASEQTPVSALAGRVVDNNGQPVVGATIQIKGTTTATSTDDEGRFRLENVDPNTVLVVSGAEFETKEIVVGERSVLTIMLARKENVLDETLVIAYGQTSRRLNTGSVTKVTAAEIERQPVSNPLLAIAGRVPGLTITPLNGLPGANTRISLRGKHSLNSGTEPFILIDGVPLSTNADRLAQVNGTSNQNLLNTINPADIQSIEVLKDAEATAIYGSQGANGVILITTKNGAAGATRVSIDSYVGFKHITRSMDLMDTREYIAMRTEAFANDQVVPTSSNAPDLVEWDPNRYTDWKELLIGNTGLTNNLQVSMQGGSATTQYRASGSWYSERSIFPDDAPARRGTGRINFSHQSPSQRLGLRAGASYSYDLRQSPINDLSSFIFLPPNAPAMKDDNGNLFWVPGLDNPFALQYRRFRGATSSFISNAEISYQLMPKWKLIVSGGYNETNLDEKSQIPIASQSPSANAAGQTHLGQGKLRSWILEPQVHGFWSWGPSNFRILAGGSLQRRLQESVMIVASEYSNDDFLDNLSAAGRLEIFNNPSQYRYIAGFGRLSWDWRQQLMASVNIRRDGSSRFGPAERFSNFHALSAGWIFSELPGWKKNLPFIGFAKLRMSYGVTGNDQIGEYEFFDSWSNNTNYSYGLGAGFLPEKLYNARLRWERTKKLQFGAEFGIWNERIRLTVDYYRNRSDNQLVNYRLPSITGFTRILTNLDALIENSGWEIMLNSKLAKQKNLQWDLMATISIPRNKLVRYPDLELSSDASRYVIGEPLGIVRRFNWLGVDATTGLYQYEDIDGDGFIKAGPDYVKAGILGPRLFGALENSIQWKSFQFDCFFQFVQQTGLSYLATLPAMPGTFTNQPVEVLDRWTNLSHSGTIQRYSRGNSSAAIAHNNFVNSTKAIVDASFIRLKNISLSYNWSATSLKRLGIEQLRLYIRGQDILTITNYRGADPETQSSLSLPPLRAWVGGISITF